MADDYVLMAALEIDAVTPSAKQFTLEGRGADEADYRVELRLEMPVDARTRTVLGELLAQSGFRIYRRVRAPLTLRRPLRTKRV